MTLTSVTTGLENGSGFYLLSPKFKIVSLNETPEFPFWDLIFCVDFDFRDSEKMENINKLKK